MQGSMCTRTRGCRVDGCCHCVQSLSVATDVQMLFMYSHWCGSIAICVWEIVSCCNTIHTCNGCLMVSIGQCLGLQPAAAAFQRGGCVMLSEHEWLIPFKTYFRYWNTQPHIRFECILSYRVPVVKRPARQLTIDVATALSPKNLGQIVHQALGVEMLLMPEG